MVMVMEEKMNQNLHSMTMKKKKKETANYLT